MYFARASTPSPSDAVLRAGRLTTPLRFAGLVAAGTGRKRSGDVRVAAGSLASLALLVVSLRDSGEPSGPRPGLNLS